VLFDKVYNLLLSKEFIAEDEYYSSLLDNNGNVLAEAKFIFTHKNVKYTVDPYSSFDLKIFIKNKFKVIELKDVIKTVNY